MSDGYAVITGMVQALEREGCDPVQLAEHEAALVVLLSRTKTLQRCERELYELGAIVAAQREGCHRVTIYRRARKLREKAKRATA